MTVKVYGKNKLMARLARLKKGLPYEVDTGITLIGRKIKEDAEENCPVGTPTTTGIPGYVGGTLKSTIRFLRTVVAGMTRAISITVGGYRKNPNTGRICDYAKHVHDGTSRMPSRPFLLNAMNRYKDTLIQMAINAVKRTR